MNIPDQRLQHFWIHRKKGYTFWIYRKKGYTFWIYKKKATLFEYTRNRLHFLNTVYNREQKHVWLFRKSITLQMFTGFYRVFTGKLECGDFKFMGIACYFTISIVIFEGNLIYRDTMGIPYIRCREIMYQLWRNHVIIWFVGISL